MRILIVEDEVRMAKLIQQGLEEDGYAVDIVGNGNDVLDWVQSVAYDAILLDIMLPGMDGINVCKQLRANGYQTPILMLTARDTLRDKVTGLDSGADDYLLKPFALEELTARLRALTRREGSLKNVQYQVADLYLDTVGKTVRRGDRLLSLTAKEYALLETLMRHPGQILSREQLIEKVWDLDFDAESKLIETYIYTLRKKIDQDNATKLIHTIRGLGYRIGGDYATD